MEMKIGGNLSKKLTENVHPHHLHHQEGDHLPLGEDHLHLKGDPLHQGKNLHLQEGDLDLVAEELHQGAGLLVHHQREARERDQPPLNQPKYTLGG